MARKKPKAPAGQFSALVLRALKQEVNRKAAGLIEDGEAVQLQGVLKDHGPTTCVPPEIQGVCQ